jgi:deoxyribodipyrimidine photo-lyase
LPIDHGVAPVEGVNGGSDSAQALLRRFLLRQLRRYGEGRLDLENRSTSGLSPYLHFGHVSSHQVFHDLVAQEDWHPGKLSSGPHRGQREGFWGMSPEAESFLDELITWRELSFNGAFHMENHHSWESLPAWARTTLVEHRDDPREHVYDLEDFEQARTHDELWNAAQRELRSQGIIHNYLRMLWGKKVLEWTADPRDALGILVELNNKYALDGRDPNSYSGIFWCFGRYDRAWGPERPIFGKIRFMSSDSARRKLKLGSYLQRFGPLSLALGGHG